MMRSFSAAILALITSVISLSGQAPQQAPQRPASLEGTTVKAGTSEPVPRARVTLVQADLSLRNVTPVTTLSDDAGRFAFTNVPAGPHILTATRDGYVRTTYGTDKPTAEIVLPAGQGVRNVVLTMTPAAAIAGRIKNSFGESMGNVLVRAERYKYEEGYKVLEDALTVLTNDLGEYRLYFLQPGTYAVSASPDNGPVASPDGTGFVGYVGNIPGNPFGRPQSRTASRRLSDLAALGMISSADSGEVYLPAYYPGVANPSLATAIDLRPGDNRTSVDFVVTAARAMSVRGRIANVPAGMSAGEASVFLMSPASGGHDWFMEISGRVDDSGDFEFRGIAPGTYDLVATLGELPEDISFGGRGLNPRPGPPGPPAPPPPRFVAKTSVQVGGTDLNGLTLELSAGRKLSGRISVEGQTVGRNDELTKDMIIQLVPVPQTFETAPAPAPVGANGAFTITGLVSGRYHLEVNYGDNFNGVGPSYIKSAELGGIDALNPTLVIDGEPRGELQIVIGSGRGVLSATVVDEKQRPVSGARIVLVPDVPRRQHFDLYETTRTNDTGKAGFAPVPGNYTAYAFEEIQAGAWWDPDVMQRYQGRGQPIQINEGGRHTLELRVIPRQP